MFAKSLISLSVEVFECETTTAIMTTPNVILGGSLEARALF